jgi:cysteinyl-tRNA synthetase
VVRRVFAIAALVYCATGFADRARLQKVERWGYRLQGIPRKPSDALDLLVIDAVDDDKKFLTKSRVASLKRRVDKPDRIVLAYLSIGEAESYRWYWQKSWNDKPPSFIAAENQEWRDNYKVRYWDARWQAIVLQYLERIIDAGFDGVYLDIIDAYEFFSDGPKPERKSAPEDMARLVGRIAEHARKDKGVVDFLVVPQNGPALLRELASESAKRYLDAIDAIAVEDTFFFGHRRENNELNLQTETLSALERYASAGKPVFSVEYVTEPRKVKKFVELARAHRFIPCIARRRLDELLEIKE